MHQPDLHHLHQVASLYYKDSTLGPLHLYNTYVREYSFPNLGFILDEIDQLETREFIPEDNESIEFMLVCILKYHKPFQLHPSTTNYIDFFLLHNLIARMEILCNVSADIFPTLMQLWPVDEVDEQGLTLLNYACIRKDAYTCDALLSEYEASIETEHSQYNNRVGTASIWFHMRTQQNNGVMKVLHFDNKSEWRLSKAQYLLQDAVLFDAFAKVTSLIHKYQLDLNQVRTVDNCTLLSYIKSPKMFDHLVDNGFQVTTKMLQREGSILKCIPVIKHMIRLGYNYKLLFSYIEPNLLKVCKQLRKQFEDELYLQTSCMSSFITSDLHKMVCGFV